MVCVGEAHGLGLSLDNRQHMLPMKELHIFTMVRAILVRVFYKTHHRARRKTQSPFSSVHTYEYTRHCSGLEAPLPWYEASKPFGRTVVHPRIELAITCVSWLTQQVVKKYARKAKIACARSAAKDLFDTNMYHVWASKM